MRERETKTVLAVRKRIPEDTSEIDIAICLVNLPSVVGSGEVGGSRNGTTSTRTTSLSRTTRFTTAWASNSTTTRAGKCMVSRHMAGLRFCSMKMNAMMSILFNVVDTDFLEMEFLQLRVPHQLQNISS
ncbi:hypothetical protein LOK49_LG07G01068 [Camellia lanceoleosa]|uniref:Uncharacterized protein n=1 Tax=Camellia lanceoleosa TaxID=1840588 RepID=A0ACC0GZW0_9ERIC|nr:hypothetical protein LOK49_LG07G01068 [Camellia lanceoleosa]